MKTNKTRSICVYTCTIYTNMHHQYYQNMIYLVGLPSVLYERLGQNDRSVLIQLFLLFFRCFSVLLMYFSWKAPLFMKTNKTRSICMYTCTIYTYMHHLHHQIPPKYKIYLVGLPSVLYKTPGQNEKSVFWISCFCCFSCAFHRKCWFSCKKYHISWKPTKSGQCVYTCTIYTYRHHQIPPKYDIPSWPSLCTLWKTRSKWQTCVDSAVFKVLFITFHVLFIKSAPLFI